MKSIITILFFAALFVILQSCNSSSQSNEDKPIQEEENKEIQSDAYTGKVFSGGIGKIEGSQMGCDGITYSEYGSYLLFQESQQVKVYNFDSSPGDSYGSVVLSGNYKAEADTIIITLDNESILRLENLTFEFSEASTLTTQIPNKKINQIEIYNLTMCSDKPALRKDVGDLFYVEMDADFVKQTKQLIAKHEKEVQESATIQDSQLSGAYISNEEGVEEIISVEAKGSSWKVRYMSENIQKHISLNVKNIDVSAQSCEVSFPSDAQTFYKMKFDKDGKLKSTDTAGKVQNFTKRN